jgi:PAS domain S-box-containing protein
VAFDIDERKENEAAREQLLQALGDSEESFRTLAEAIPQQVWTALPDGALDFVNRRVVDYFAMPMQAILGAGWKDVLHPDDLAESTKRWLHSLATGEEYETELRLRRADGNCCCSWTARTSGPRASPGGSTLRPNGLHG